MSNSNLRQLEGGRAAYAFECAQKGSKIKESVAYKSYIKKLPMLIKTNGLGAAYAFVLSKKDEDKDKKGYAYNLIYFQTEKWLKDHRFYLVNFKRESGEDLTLDPANRKDLVWLLTNMQSHEYRAVTVEVLALLNWLRRFVDGLIEGDDTDVDA